MNARKFVTVALVATCAFALSACASSPSPTKPTMSAKSHSTESASSPEISSSSNNAEEYKPATSKEPAKNVALPKMPAAAKSPTADGARAFSEYYFDIINYAVETNDSQPLKNVSTHSCQVCGESLIDPADAAKRAGSWQVGGKHSYEVLDSYMSAKNKAAVTMSFETDKSVLYSSDKRKPLEVPESKAEIIALGIEFNDGWKVYRILFDEN